VGLGETLFESGYAWLRSRIDWEEMVFRSQIAPDIAFVDDLLRNTYRKNWLSVKDIIDDFGRLELLGK